MFDNIIVCGDSYGLGIGLNQQYCIEKSFGGLLSEELNLPFKTFARSGVCNFGIYLQVKKVIEENLKDKSKPLVLITLTDPSRVFLPNQNIGPNDLNLSNMDYLSTQPYSEHSNPRRTPPFNLNQNPKLFSQTINDINSHYRHGVSGVSKSAFDLLPKYKFETLINYISDLYCDTTKEEIDSGIVSKMHLLLKHHNICHIIITNKVKDFDYIDNKNLCDFNWREVSDLYPDETKSSHCNEYGHELAKETILKKIKTFI